MAAENAISILVATGILLVCSERLLFPKSCISHRELSSRVAYSTCRWLLIIESINPSTERLSRPADASRQQDPRNLRLSEGDTSTVAP